MFRAVILAAAIAISTAACGSPRRTHTAADDSTATASAAAATPTVVDTPVPQPTAVVVPSTGIPNVDDIIRLELAGNGEALAARLRMKQEACSFHPVYGYPVPCATGETERQLVEAFSVGHCEGTEVRADEARRQVVAESRTTELYAVLASAEPGASGAPVYTVVFASGFTYVVDGEQITAWYESCGGIGTVESSRDRLVPLANTALPEDRSTKIAPVDAIIAAAERGDGAYVAARLSYQNSGCSLKNSPDDPLHCQPENSIAFVFPAARCAVTLIRSSEAEALVAGAVSAAPTRLYAIVLAPRFEQSWNYRLLFARGDGADARGFVLDVLDGRVVRFDDGCGPLGRRAAAITDFLAPPATPGVQTAPDAVTTVGIADLDEIARLVSIGDNGAVVAKMMVSRVACGNGGGDLTLKCRPGESPGTVDDAVIAGACVFSYERVADAVENPIISPGLELYSIFRPWPTFRSGDYDRLFPAAYIMLFALSARPDSPTVEVDVGTGKILSVSPVDCFGGRHYDGVSALQQILPPPNER